MGTINDDDLSVAISSPATNPFTATQTFVPLAGAAADLGGIQQVTWTNSTGGNGTATGTTTWSAQVPCPGANVITVTATDTNGYSASASLTVNVGELSYYLAEGATGSSGISTSRSPTPTRSRRQSPSRSSRRTRPG